MPIAPVAKRTPSNGAIVGADLGARGESVDCCAMIDSLDCVYLVNR